jgi:primosomal protein N'
MLICCCRGVMRRRGCPISSWSICGGIAPARGGFLSPVLLKAMAGTLDRGEQSLLFLNRRGYAPLTLCRVCGHRFECPDCSSWLVEHRFRAQLQCHHCGHNEPTPQACPSCGALDHLVACGPGIERIAEEADKHFPDARTIVLSSDMAGGTRRLRIELEAIAKGEADIVIGTQLVAKGHNFPLMTLVGVVDADLGRLAGVILSGPDLAQLTQVAERLARACEPLTTIGADLWGPAPAPIARIRGRHRLRMLIRADKGAPLQDAITLWLDGLRLPPNARLAVDIDPQSFF